MSRCAAIAPFDSGARLDLDLDAVGDVEAGVLAGDLDEADEVAREPLALERGVDIRVEHDDAGRAVEAGRVQPFLRPEAELVLAGLDPLAGDLDDAVADRLPGARLRRGEHVLHRRGQALAEDARVDRQHLGVRTASGSAAKSHAP